MWIGDRRSKSAEGAPTMRILALSATGNDERFIAGCFDGLVLAAPV
jgi:hypothetical protein